MDIPENWVHEPKDMKLKSWPDIPIHDIWKHKEREEILIHFSTPVKHYVEKHKNPKMVESRLRRLKDIFSQEDVKVQIPKVTVTGGQHLSSGYGSEVTEEAIYYMNSNP